VFGSRRDRGHLLVAAVVRVLEDLDARQVLVEALAVPARGALLQAVLSASPMVLSLDSDEKSARRLPPRRPQRQPRAAEASAPPYAIEEVSRTPITTS